jgi:hypothetical protein
MNIVNALDNHTMKAVGENGNVEYSWSNSFTEKFTQFYFQLVRTKDTSSLEKALHDMIVEFSQKDTETPYTQFGTILKYEREFVQLYKLIGHTRDIKEGKGEYSLSYMQLWVWYQHHPELAVKALESFVDIDGMHPYGSWKDMKYFAEYVKNKTDDESHPLIDTCASMMCQQLEKDLVSMDENSSVSLAGRWCPREKGRFGWLFKKVAHQMFSEFFNTPASRTDKNVAKLASRKARTYLRKRLSSLNRYLDTTQIKMCGGEWSEIDFNNVTSRTMEKSKKAFLNSKNKNDIDRVNCATNLQNHVQKAMSGDETAKVRGKRVDVYELVRSAINARNGTPEANVVNLQWKDNATQNRGLKNIIPMADTSGSMSCDNNTPLYNSIGLSLRISELAEAPFNNRIMTFNSTPEWIRLTDNMTFTEKVKHVARSNWGMNTNFYAAMRMILDAALESNMKPEDVSSMTLAIFSDMQIDQASRENTNTMMQNITDMYHQAGLQSAWKTPFEPPHILFWNLRKTDGFPVLSTKNNVTMLSGYSAQLLNVFCNKGIDELKTMTPYKMISDLLTNERYKPLESIAMSSLH